MSSVIQIKHGSATEEGTMPSGKLAPYELGYADNCGLFIGGPLKANGDLGDAIPIVPEKVKASEISDQTNGFTEEAKEIIEGIKVANATKADSAAEADKADSATNATNATNADNFKIDSQYVNYETLKSTLLNATYPVGSIYMSVNDTSPANLFGGTWEKLEDRFLVGAGNAFSAGEKNGSALHSHTLGDNAYAKINHHEGNFYFEEVEVEAYKTSGKGSSSGAFYESSGETSAIPLSGTTDSASNLPPYLAVYMWKRTT